MDKVYTLTELVNEFGFENAGAKAFIKRSGIKPVRVMKVGRREFTLYGELTRALFAEERKRRNDARAERSKQRTAAMKPSNTPVAGTPTISVADMIASLAGLVSTLVAASENQGLKQDRILEAVEAQTAKLEMLRTEVRNLSTTMLTTPPFGPPPFGPTWFANNAAGNVSAGAVQQPLPAIDIESMLVSGEPVPVDD